MHPAGLLDGPQHNNIIRSPSKINPILTPHIHQPLTLRLVIISFRPAWLARVLLCYKRTQSSGND